MNGFRTWFFGVGFLNVLNSCTMNFHNFFVFSIYLPIRVFVVVFVVTYNINDCFLGFEKESNWTFLTFSFNYLWFERHENRFFSNFPWSFGFWLFCRFLYSYDLFWILTVESYESQLSPMEIISNLFKCKTLP